MSIQDPHPLHTLIPPNDVEPLGPSTSENGPRVPKVRVGVLLLAGGLGRRFDDSMGRRTTGKLLARMPDGTPVGVKTASVLMQSSLPVLAVVRETGELANRFSEQGCTVLVSADAGRGMGASLAAGARWYAAQNSENGGPRYDAVLVALADMPWVQTSTLSRLLDYASLDAIAVPVCRGVRGHPVLFGRAHWPALAHLDGDTGAKGLLNSPDLIKVNVEDEGIHRDVDTRDDLDVIWSEPKFL